MKETFTLLAQAALLAVIYWGSVFLVRLGSLPIPAGILGIVILFILLLSGLIREEWIAFAATFLLRHLVFFFIPISVAIMDWADVFTGKGAWVSALIIVSSWVPLLCVGFLLRKPHPDTKK